MIVTFETEKDSYSSLSAARYGVTIENTSNKTVVNISAKCDFESIQPIDANSVLEIDGVSLNAVESYSFTFYATVHRQADFYEQWNYYCRICGVRI